MYFFVHLSIMNKLLMNTIRPQQKAIGWSNLKKCFLAYVTLAIGQWATPTSSNS